VAAGFQYRVGVYDSYAYRDKEVVGVFVCVFRAPLHHQNYLIAVSSDKFLLFQL
jgi:hypothetical protein